MRWKEYQKAVQKLGFKIANDALSIYAFHILNKDGEQVLAFHAKTKLMTTDDSQYPQGVVDIHTMMELCQLTDELIQTPNILRQLEPIYRLLWSKDDFGYWLIGYDFKHRKWQIGRYGELTSNGFQTEFTGDELQDLATNDQTLADKINMLKTRVN